MRQRQAVLILVRLLAGWMIKDIREWIVVDEIRTIYDNYDFDTEIIVASITKPITCKRLLHLWALI